MGRRGRTPLVGVWRLKNVASEVAITKQEWNIKIIVIKGLNFRNWKIRRRKQNQIKNSKNKWVGKGK